MAWVRLDDGFFGHPKAQAIGQRGRELYLSALCWSSQNLTDGHVPATAWRRIGADAGVKPGSVRSLVGTLVGAGLLHENGDGWVIHDFLDYNRSRSAVLAEREAARKRQARHRHEQER